MSTKSMKILVIYENGAGGHRSAAKAIAEALDAHPHVESLVIELDALAPKYRKKMYSGFIEMRRIFARISRMGFHLGLRPNPLLSLYRGLGDIIQPRSLRRFLDVVKKEKPDLIVTTHFRPNVACSVWRKQGLLQIPVFAMIPDFVAHGLYPREKIDRYYVASEEVRQDLIGLGVPASDVVATGIPVSRAMIEPDPRPIGDIKKSLGIDPQRQTILLLGGARGDHEQFQAVQEVVGQRSDVQVAVICGWNTELRDKIDAFAKERNLPVYAKGFQSNMPEWFRAADVVITKAGSLTPAESMALGKATLICGAHPGKEEFQGARLAQAGAVSLGKTPQSAVAEAFRILADPPKRESMEQGASRYGRPHAARDIAKDAIDFITAMRSRS